MAPIHGQPLVVFLVKGKRRFYARMMGEDAKQFVLWIPPYGPSFRERSPDRIKGSVVETWEVWRYRRVMAKLDRIKEDCAYLRLWLGVLIATDIGLFGWALTQFGRVSGWLLASAALCFLALGGVRFVLHRQIERKSIEIEGL